MKKTKSNDKNAISNAAVITALSACVMFGAVGMYRMTTGEKSADDRGHTENIVRENVAEEANEATETES